VLVIRSHVAARDRNVLPARIAQRKNPSVKRRCLYHFRTACIQSATVRHVAANEAEERFTMPRRTTFLYARAFAHRIKDGASTERKSVRQVNL
jgi:hypothetical protein